MSKSGGPAREVAMPVAAFDGLRREILEHAGMLGSVRALHDAGYRAGLAAAAAVHQGAGGDSFRLSEHGFWSNLADYFTRRGWGTLSHETPHPAIGVLSATDWWEATPDDVQPEGACSFSAGFLSGLLSQLAGGPIAVLEVQCRTRGDDRCAFAFGSESAVHELYGAMVDGVDLTSALQAL